MLDQHSPSRFVRFYPAIFALLCLGLSACNNGPEPGPGPGNGNGNGNGNGESNGTPTVFVRQNVKNLTNTQLQALRTGISTMQGRAETDPTSWLYQANIHGTTQTPLQTAWRTCQHGSWHFLSWHRMYLYYFEKILRAASGDANFALPYWNYSEDLSINPDARRIPLPYRQPADASNSLFIPQRNPVMNAGGELPASTVSLAALNRINFSSAAGSGLSFGGQRSGPGHNLGPHSVFESTPHDAVHIDVGGFMSSFATAARDPVFWAHHCNIDRLWVSWLAMGGGRANPTPPQGDPWLTQTFEFFDIDSGTNGAFVTLTGADILNTVTQLDYRYDDQPAAEEAEPEPAAQVTEEAEPMAPRILADIDASGTTLRNDPVSVSLTVVEEEAEDEGELVLRLDEVTIGAMPTGHYEVYVNLPEGAEPDHESVYHVGNLSFFGLSPAGSGGESESAAYTYSLADLERELKAQNQWTGDIEITFVKSGPIPPPDMEVVVEEAEAPVNVGRIKVSRE